MSAAIVDFASVMDAVERAAADSAANPSTNHASDAAKRKPSIHGTDNAASVRLSMLTAPIRTQLRGQHATHRVLEPSYFVGFELGASPFLQVRMFCQLALCDLRTVCIEQFAPPGRSRGE